MKESLDHKSDLEWFDFMCETLKKNNYPTVKKLKEIIGGVSLAPIDKYKYGELLIPSDNRFKWAWINPLVSNDGGNHSIDDLSFDGANFTLNMKDLTSRFFKYRVENITNGNTQLFFYPVPECYNFSAISFKTNQKIKDIANGYTLMLESFSFQFGAKLFSTQSGFIMTK